MTDRIFIRAFALVFPAIFTSMPRAQDVTIHIAARVEMVDSRDGYLDGLVRVGDEITGSYTYNLSTPDENDLETVGDYWHRSGPYGIDLRLNGRRYASRQDSLSFLVELVNDHGNPPSDNYLLRSYNNFAEPALPRGGFVDHISWQLDDPGLRALSSTRLTPEAPSLGDWQSFFGLDISGCVDEPGFPGPPGSCFSGLLAAAP